MSTGFGRNKRRLFGVALGLVLVAAGVAVELDHLYATSRDGTLSLIVGDLPEGLFTEGGTELYHWPKLGYEQRVTLRLSAGTYIYEAGLGACPPSDYVTVAPGKATTFPFIPISPNEPGAGHNKCFALRN